MWLLFRHPEAKINYKDPKPIMFCHLR